MFTLIIDSNKYTINDELENIEEKLDEKNNVLLEYRAKLEQNNKYAISTMASRCKLPSKSKKYSI